MSGSEKNLANDLKCEQKRKHTIYFKISTIGRLGDTASDGK